jgi:Xaa-Pro aminopeptidase
MPIDLDAFRSAFADAGMNAYLVTGTDPHISEYPPEKWETRRYFTGFTGSAGRVAITAELAGLWTDSRYFLQAEEELAGTGFVLFKDGLPDTPDIIDYLARELPSGAVVGVDGRSISVDAFEAAHKTLARKGIDLRVEGKLLDLVWPERPTLPAESVYAIPRTNEHKLDTIRAAFSDNGADWLLVTALDEIAWLTDLRGSDVGYNPVFLAYMLLGSERSFIFIDDTRLGDDARARLQDLDIQVQAYDRLEDTLASLEGRVQLDPKLVTRAIFESLIGRDKALLRASPIMAAKAKKNPQELANVRKVMVADGLALVKFFRWMERTLPSNTLDEADAAEVLKNFRAETPGFVGESFSAVVGYGPNGALNHYRPQKPKARLLDGHGLLLMDSGGQYRYGTTDITRMWSVGEPTPEERRDCTLVLKAHIGVATAIFPRGTRGYMIDAFARRPLWDLRLNFGHGTGHGVGYFLNVHEGPASIRSNPIDVSLEPGMVLSNEPGLYRDGQHGVRIENLVTIVEDESNEFGTFYRFDELTLFPFERRLIDTRLLEPFEIRWVDRYHQRVYEALSPHLEEDDRDWLADKTQKLHAD